MLKAHVANLPLPQGPFFLPFSSPGKNLDGPNLCQALTAAQPATSWEEAVKVSKYTDTAAGGQPCKSGSSCVQRGGPLGYTATPPGTLNLYLLPFTSIAQ